MKREYTKAELVRINYWRWRVETLRDLARLERREKQSPLMLLRLQAE